LGLRAFMMGRMSAAPVQFIRGRRVKDSMLTREAKPAWLKVRAPGSPNYLRLRGLMRDLNLHTVCEEAHCPNIGECWHHGTATFMILGDICTRACTYCAVAHGRPATLDIDEPRRVGEAVEKMALKYAVITSVDRDDLPDGGASIFAEAVTRTRALVPSCRLEVLIPDFQGDERALRIVLDARPDVLNHNTETVPRLYRQVRLGARYERSLQLLAAAKAMSPEAPTKSGLMLGLGETPAEVLAVMRDLRASHVDMLTLGQYLSPSPKHLPVMRYIPPGEFDQYRHAGREMGFTHVEAGPLVRSSYHAAEAL